MTRRVHVSRLRPGEPVALDRAEAHHARDVLRLADGAAVEVFDDAGAVGKGVLLLNGADVSVRVERAEQAGRDGRVWLCVAAAVPKGDRADWMVEKLSELGVDEFVPLAAARSVVLPEGRGKRERWNRIATEAAKQSRRAGVMRITELTGLSAALARAIDSAQGGRAWFLTTEEAAAVPVAAALRELSAGARLTAFVGPEGGWTAEERQQFAAAGAIAVRLGPTILRVETAAVAAAAAVAVACAPPQPRGHGDDAS